MDATSSERLSHMLRSARTFFGARRALPPPDPEPALAPPPPPPPPKPPMFDSVLGEHSSMSGTFRADANVRLDGHFEGTLVLNGSVLVGVTGEIIADVHARNVSVAGIVRGDVSGRRVHLLATGRVYGDITAVKFAAEEGALLQGSVNIVADDAPPALPGTPTPPLPARLRPEGHDRANTPPSERPSA